MNAGNYFDPYERFEKFIKKDKIKKKNKRSPRKEAIRIKKQFLYSKD